MTSGSETSRTRTSRACLEDAADAAVRAKSRLVGRGELLDLGASGTSTVASPGAVRTWEISLGIARGGSGGSVVAGRSAIEGVLLDVAGDSVGDQVLDGGAAGDPGPDVAGGDGQGRDVHAVDPAGPARHLADQAFQVEAGPGGGDELGQGEDLVGLLPGEDLEHGVGPGDEEQAGAGRALGPGAAPGGDRGGGGLGGGVPPADRGGRG